MRGDATDPDAMRRGSSRPAPVRARLRAEKKTGRGRLRPRRGVDELRVPGARARGLGAVDVVVVARVVGRRDRVFVVRRVVDAAAGRRRGVHRDRAAAGGCGGRGRRPLGRREAAAGSAAEHERAAAVGGEESQAMAVDAARDGVAASAAVAVDDRRVLEDVPRGREEDANDSSDAVADAATRGRDGRGERAAALTGDVDPAAAAQLGARVRKAFDGVY